MSAGGKLLPPGGIVPLQAARRSKVCERCEARVLPPRQA